MVARPQRGRGGQARGATARTGTAPAVWSPSVEPDHLTSPQPPAQAFDVPVFAGPAFTAPAFAAPAATARAFAAQRPPTSPYLPEGVVDTRPKGLALDELQVAVHEAGFEFRPAPGSGEPAVVDGVLDARPSTGALVLGSVNRPGLPAPVRVVDLRESAVPCAPRQLVDLRESTVTVPVEVEAVLETETVDVRVLSPYPSRAELRRREAAGGSGSTRKGFSASLSVPQVGIASALGLATIAAPLTGSLIPPTASSSSVATTLDVAGAPRSSAALGDAPFPMVAAAGANGVEAPAVVGDDSPIPSVPAALSAPSRVLVTKVSRSNERAVLPGCDGVVPAAAATAKNGQLPAPELCTLWDADHQLRNDAAVALARLNVAYQQTFGKPLCLVDAYRTLAKQYAVKASRGYLAATPGTSEHGWGRAIDLCGGAAVEGTSTYTWLRANGPRYGWDNPEWARSGGSGPHEAWHFEYFAGGAGGTSASENEG